MHSIFEFIVNFLVAFISKIGYLGIFIGMFLESTLVPIPSEVIMIPAGIAAAKGNFNIYLIIIIGTLGNVFGAIFSYYLAKKIGRALIFKIGKYFFIKPEAIIKIENYFKKHGPISVFIGRLLPGFRHFISLPAGLANMNFRLFWIYTSLGSAIWTSILAILGFVIGDNEQLIAQNLEVIAIVVLVSCVFILFYYLLKKK